MQQTRTSTPLHTKVIPSGTAVGQVGFWPDHFINLHMRTLQSQTQSIPEKLPIIGFPFFIAIPFGLLNGHSITATKPRHGVLRTAGQNILSGVHAAKFKNTDSVIPINLSPCGCVVNQNFVCQETQVRRLLQAKYSLQEHARRYLPYIAIMRNLSITTSQYGDVVTIKILFAKSAEDTVFLSQKWPQKRFLNVEKVFWGSMPPTPLQLLCAYYHETLAAPPLNSYHPVYIIQTHPTQVLIPKYVHAYLIEHFVLSEEHKHWNCIHITLGNCTLESERKRERE